MRTGSRQAMIIAGAGVPGLALAVALKTALGSALDIVVCDPATETVRTSGRATALASGPRKMFEALGIWAKIESLAQPIETMIITDSKPDDTVRPVYLQFGGDSARTEPLAHMVEDDDLVHALMEAARNLGVEFVASAISDVKKTDVAVFAELPQGRRISGQILVAADGGNSHLRTKAGIATTGWDYRQMGIVATLAHENPHEGRAEEHFLPEGPFAVLPLRGNRISIVWTFTPEAARNAIALPAAEFAGQIQALTGFRLGNMQLIGPPRAFPLSLKLARRFIAPRTALLGDAAHVIHPIAGQGLNLGLRDAAVLAESITDQVQLGLDIGASDMLEAYQRQRRFDTLAMAGATDMLNRLFGNDSLPLRMARDFGLGLVERLAPLKHYFIDEAGGGNESGKLMRGIWP